MLLSRFFNSNNAGVFLTFKLAGHGYIVTCLGYLGALLGDMESHQFHVQALVCLLLGSLLLGSDGSQGVIGVHSHCVHQGFILGLGGVARHLEVEFGANNGLVEVVEGEVGSSHSEILLSVHSSFLSGTFGLGGRSQP